MKKYIQLYNILREQITTGALPPGSHLPTENAVAETYAVSRQTVRQALELLRKDGFIYSVQGSGSFVGSTSVRTPENRRIAVITTYFSEYIFPAILRGINETAVENGYTIEISATNNSISAERNILRTILRHPVAGIIAEGTKAALPNPNTVYYQTLNQTGVPIVFINSVYAGTERDRIVSVTTDDFNGGYQLAKNLIQKGYTSIGCVFKSDDAQGINRFAGVISALEDSNVEYNDANFIWFTTETKSFLLSVLVSSGFFSNCSAIICYNDEIAAEICPYLKRGGHNIRAIASFDHYLNSSLIPAGIEFTSLSHPRDTLGGIAARKLFNMLSDKPEVSAVLPWRED